MYEYVCVKFIPLKVHIHKTSTMDFYTTIYLNGKWISTANPKNTGNGASVFEDYGEYLTVSVDIPVGAGDNAYVTNVHGLSFGFSLLFQTCEPLFDVLYFLSCRDIHAIQQTCCHLFHLIFQIFSCLF